MAWEWEISTAPKLHSEYYDIFTFTCTFTCTQYSVKYTFTCRIETDCNKPVTIDYIHVTKPSAGMLLVACLSMSQYTNSHHLQMLLLQQVSALHAWLTGKRIYDVVPGCVTFALYSLKMKMNKCCKTV